jgi:phytoene dehydrogenase-like protein
MPSSDRDIVVIGGGTNGLACAARLAKSGRRVTLLEAGEVCGGGAVTTAFAEGFRVSGLAHLVTTLDRRVASEMQLSSHGLTWAETDMATTALGPRPLTIRRGETADLDAADARAWAALHKRLDRYAGLLAPFREMTPPRLSRKGGNDFKALARMGLDVRRMGKDEVRELLRVFLINVADLLEDDLSDDRLMGLVAFDATLGSWLGPRSPNSLLLLLNRMAGEAAGRRGAIALPRGGMGAVSAAMVASAKASGVTIRTGARVAAIRTADDRAAGVMLDTGEEIAAGLVVSAISPQATLRHLAGPRHLDTGTLRQVRGIKSRGGAAKLHIALKAAPDFGGADLRHRLVIAPSVNAVELAFNPVKYGEVPERPVMEITIPTAHEPELAPAGHHVLSAIVQFAPHAPTDRDGAKAQMLENTLTVLEDHAPGLRASILHTELLMPWEIEARYGMAGGNWHHAELSVEQMLFLRPFHGAAQYESPLPALWLASAGSHPGGGVSGAAGWNAAGRILGGRA